MTLRCECGDTECPSCGTAQGTYDPERADLERDIRREQRFMTCQTIGSEAWTNSRNHLDRLYSRLDKLNGE